MIKIEIIYPDIHNQHIKMIKSFQKPFLGKSDPLSCAMVDLYNKQLIKIAELAIPEYLWRKK